MSIRTCAIGVLAAAALTACGNDRGGDDTAIGLMRQAVAGLGGSDSAQKPGADAIARTALTRLKEPVMVAEIPANDAVAALVPYGRNGSVETWTTIDFQTVSLRGGRIVATRGLGADLMAVSESGMRRTYHLMDAANGEMPVTVDCAPRIAGPEVITLAGGEVLRTTRVDETCSGPDAEFVNQYWAGTDGSFRRSRQWIGPQSGYVELQRLR